MTSQDPSAKQFLADNPDVEVFEVLLVDLNGQVAADTKEILDESVHREKPLRLHGAVQMRTGH